MLQPLDEEVINEVLSDLRIASEVLHLSCLTFVVCSKYNCPVNLWLKDCMECVDCSHTVTLQAAPTWAKSWHQWGLFNLRLLTHYHAAKQPDRAVYHVAPAVVGFFRSVALGQADGARHVMLASAFAQVQLTCQGTCYL